MQQQNYWKQLAEQVNAGDANAAQAFPKELEKCLSILVRTSLKRRSDDSTVGRVANEIARRVGPSGNADGDASLVERVTRGIASKVSQRLEVIHAPQGRAVETVLG
jgi:hypothetical protein